LLTGGEGAASREGKQVVDILHARKKVEAGDGEKSEHVVSRQTIHD